MNVYQENGYKNRRDFPPQKSNREQQQRRGQMLHDWTGWPIRITKSAMCNFLRIA